MHEPSSATAAPLKPRRRRVRWLLAVTSVAAVAAATLVALVPASAAPTRLVSAASSRCLDVTGNRSTAGTGVSIWDCNGQANQTWNFTAAGELRVFNDSMCLDAFNAGTRAGTRLIIWNCTGARNQRFVHNSNGTITGVASGLCLDVSRAATANGTAVVLWTCSGQAHQRWSSGGATTQPPVTTATTRPPVTSQPPTEPCSVAPVNPNASPQARRLLCYIHSQYGNHILSGQQESTWIGGPDYEINYIHDNTGKYPAIRSLDFGDSHESLTPRAIAYWQAGGIPMIGYHMGAPTRPDTYAGSTETVSIDRVLTPGTAEYTSFIERLDQVSASLQQMEDQNVAVIWRPFHEAGGTFLWWSKEGGAQYNRLWHFTYDYMTNTKGLDNLVWLHGFNGSPRATFYPGKQYFDIGGANTYAGYGNYGPLTSVFTAVRNIVGAGVPIALHENGPIPDPNQMQSAGAHWVLFNTWHGNYVTVANSAAHLNMVYNHPYVVTRDEVPNLR